MIRSIFACGFIFISLASYGEGPPAPTKKAVSSTSTKKAGPTAKKPVETPPAKKTSNLPALLQEVQAQYQMSSGIEARFDQTTDIRATKQVKKASGRIYIKRPNKLRWETLEPDPNILISDGKTFWFYTPPYEKEDRGQVIVKKTAQVQTQFLNALLSGSFDFEKGATSVEQKSPKIFLLKPKAGTAGDVQTAQITINSDKHMITEVLLTHTSGNRTEIKLQNINLNGKLEDKMFHFIPDRNTDKIYE